MGFSWIDAGAQTSDFFSPQLAIEHSHGCYIATSRSWCKILAKATLLASKIIVDSHIYM